MKHIFVPLVTVAIILHSAKGQTFDKPEGKESYSLRFFMSIAKVILFLRNFPARTRHARTRHLPCKKSRQIQVRMSNTEP